ncbi:MAG: tRNA pseudouridine(55) synthase TruB [Gammaproteobacteria bacterium]|nr:tRNA pseudouridine(55) synthase TruB [Gammaproteobacteria bacterium]
MTRPAPCGWLLLDKPVGLSSARAVSRVKRLFQVKRAGHAGTLDPLASGLLAIALGPATRWCAYLLDAPKSYRFTIRLGQETDSHDAESLEQAAPPCAEIPSLEQAEIEALLSRFTGTIQQTPPMYSALHSEGRRLYELAREGKEVDRPAREVRIDQLGLIAARREEWDLEVRCGKGTYVRTLGHDIGQALGCGAYVSQLRRTGLGTFDESQAVSLKQVEADSEEARLARLLPADAVLPEWPVRACTASEAEALRHGKQISHEGPAGFWKLEDAQGRFFGVAELLDTGRLQPRRLMAGPEDSVQSEP